MGEGWADRIRTSPLARVYWPPSSSAVTVEVVGDERRGSVLDEVCWLSPESEAPLDERIRECFLLQAVDRSRAESVRHTHEREVSAALKVPPRPVIGEGCSCPNREACSQLTELDRDEGERRLLHCQEDPDHRLRLLSAAGLKVFCDHRPSLDVPVQEVGCPYVTMRYPRIVGGEVERKRCQPSNPPPQCFSLESGFFDEENAVMLTSTPLMSHFSPPFCFETYLSRPRLAENFSFAKM